MNLLPDDEIITVEELCEILNIGKNTAYTLLNRQVIPGFRIGRHWKISRNALADYITRQSAR